MKSNRIKYFAILLSLCFGCFLISCSDFLDADDLDDQISIEAVFRTKADTEKFLANIYRYMRTDNGWSNESVWTAISDELDVTYQDYGPNYINNGSMTAANPHNDFWGSYYKGIRSANFFMLHVDKNPELTDELKLQYKAEARFLRAFFYFALFRQYGPVVLLDDNIIPSDAPVEEFSIPRRSVSEVVSYIEAELDSTLAMNILPEKFKEQASTEYGRITAGACRALKSRLLLYAASDFYNRDVNPFTEFSNFKNKDGKLLFDYTNQEKSARWSKAAKAAKDVIDMNFELYTEFTTAGVLDPYASCKNIFFTEWNNEVIYAKPDGGWTEMDQACSPRMTSTNAWNGWAPTQHVVDAYFTMNGLSIDKDPTYTESGFSTAANTEQGYAAKTFNMYVNREPRFYVSITFSNSRWITKVNNNIVQFYAGGNSGYNSSSNSRNFSRTGYLAKKFVSVDSDPATSKWPKRHYIFFRLGEFYLNYVEALNEVDYAANETEILYYLNEIRKRAGIPEYGNGLGQIPVTGGQAEMRELIRKERRVELAFEAHRYFDCKRWIISHNAEGGNFYGMNIYEGESGFYKRTVFEKRSFQTKNYLWPIKTSEIYKGGQLVQNPGW